MPDLTTIVANVIADHEPVYSWSAPLVANEVLAAVTAAGWVPPWQHQEALDAMALALTVYTDGTTDARKQTIVNRLADRLAEGRLP